MQKSGSGMKPQPNGLFGLKSTLASIFSSQELWHPIKTFFAGLLCFSCLVDKQWEWECELSLKVL